MAKANNAFDQFSNLATISTTESAANTLTFKKLETGISLQDKVAWVISRIEYFTSDMNNTVFNATDDILSFGLSVGNTFSSPTLTEPTILDLVYVYRRDFGTAATGGFQTMPIVKDFSDLPGGGILLAPVPLYGFIKGSGLTAAATIVARINYTLMPLAVDQYWQLVESRRVIQS